MWAAHVGPTKQPTKNPVGTQFRPIESPLKKGENTNESHVGPMFSPHMG